MSQSAAGLASAGDSDPTIGTLKEILADTERVQELTKSSHSRMREVLSCLEQSRSPLLILTKLPELLNATGMLARIEGGRLQNAGVDISSLAADISNLKERVQRNVNVIANDAARLTRLVAESVQQLDRTQGQGQEEAGNLIGHARSVLEALQSRAQSSNSAAARIDQQYAAIRCDRQNRDVAPGRRHGAAARRAHPGSAAASCGCSRSGRTAGKLPQHCRPPAIATDEHSRLSE